MPPPHLSAVKRDASIVTLVHADARLPIQRLVSSELDVAAVMLRLRDEVRRKLGVTVGELDMSALSGQSAVRRLDELLIIENEDFVELSFKTVLRRDVDNRAFYFYMRQLDGGRSRLDILSELLSSGEAAEKAAAGKLAKAVLRQHDSLRFEIEAQRVDLNKPEVNVAARKDLSQPGITSRSQASHGDAATEEALHAISEEVGDTNATLAPVVPQVGKQLSAFAAEVDVEAIFSSLKASLASGSAVRQGRTTAVDVLARKSAGGSSLIVKPTEIGQIQIPVGNSSPTSQLVFRVGELLWGSDKAFIERAYEALLGRKPDADGESHYLRMLAGGVAKVDILASILRSNEAAHRRVQVLGMRGRQLMARVAQWPVVGSTFKKMADRSKANYVHIDSLRSFYDEDFVRHVYRAILGRAPDPSGAERYVRSLRNGEHKVRLIWDIRNSGEGQRRNVRVDGLLTAYAWQVVVDTPVIGAVGQFALSLIKSPQRRRAARLREARTERMFTALRQSMSSMQKTVNSGFGTLKQAIDNVAAQNNLLAEVDKSKELQTYLHELTARIAILEAQSDVLHSSLIKIVATEDGE